MCLACGATSSVVAMINFIINTPLSEVLSFGKYSFTQQYSANIYQARHLLCGHVWFSDATLSNGLKTCLSQVFFFFWHPKSLVLKTLGGKIQNSVLEELGGKNQQELCKEVKQARCSSSLRRHWRGLSQQAYLLWGQTVTTHAVLLAGVNASEEKLHCRVGTARRFYPRLPLTFLAQQFEMPWVSPVSSSLLPWNTKGNTRCPSLWKILQGKLVYLPSVILLRKLKLQCKEPITESNLDSFVFLCSFIM